MKIAGMKTGLNKETVELPRSNGKSISLTLTALPMGFLDDIKDMIPNPIPKTLGVARKNGKVERDRDGSPVVLKDTESLAFKRKVSEANRLQTTILIWQSLKDDANIEFEAQPPTETFRGGETDSETAKVWKDFASKIYEEMKAAGFSTGDFAYLVKQILNVSNLNSEKLEEVREVFSQGEEDAI